MDSNSQKKNQSSPILRCGILPKGRSSSTNESPFFAHRISAPALAVANTRGANHDFNCVEVALVNEESMPQLGLKDRYDEVCNMGKEGVDWTNTNLNALV
jgi:hypothetical protein